MEIAEEFQTSALMGTGQFCTNPGIVVLQAGEEAEQFIAEMQGRFEKAQPAPLLGVSGLKSLGESVEALQSAGATLVTGGSKADGSGCRFQNTLVKTTGEAFIQDPEKLTNGSVWEREPVRGGQRCGRARESGEQLRRQSHRNDLLGYGGWG